MRLPATLGEHGVAGAAAHAREPEGVLIILWLLGYLGPTRIPQIPKTGNLIHILLIIVLILIIVRLLG